MVTTGGTVCFYMGATRLEAISQALRKEGLASATPVAIVQWGTTARQKCLRTNLARAAAAATAVGIGAPAIIVVGAVAGIEAPGLDHFVRRPLFGRRILITRTRQQASELRLKLEELGAEVLEAPTIELVSLPPGALAKVDDALRDLKQFDWLVLTSINGVEALTRRLAQLGGDARSLAGVRVATIGEPTAAALHAQLGIRADLVPPPPEFVAESLAAALIARGDIKGKRFLLLRADIARPALPKLLAEAGAVVTDLAIYETRPAPGLPNDVTAALRSGGIDWVTFTSASTARNLADLLGPDRKLLERVQTASIGPITSNAIRELGLRVTVEAVESTIEGLVAAIAAAPR
jgi:uroporphyrinogen III methyltransferase/synthase